jgi:hypothetical protein
MKRKVLALIFSLIFLSAVSVFFPSSVKAVTNVYGVISADTTWTKANSPYYLTGAIAVNQGIKLTIEAGVTIDLADTYIQVNGTLIAVGSNDDKISFNGGGLRFTDTSTSWNQQTQSGSIVQNAILNCTINISGSSPKIDSNIVLATMSVDGSPSISNNTFRNEISIVSGSPVVSNNIFVNSLISTYSLQSSGYLPIIANNSMTGQGVKCYGGTGVGGYALISGNSISGCDTAIFGGASIIQNNYIFGNNIGIDTLNGTILNNTITNNIKGINIPADIIYFFGFGELPNTPTIMYNNLASNINYAIYNTASNNITATYNWWGTNDTELISQQIYDYRKDFSLGNVTFTPFLVSPNPDTFPAAPVIPEFSSWSILPLFMIVTLLVSIVYFRKRKH